MKATIKALAAAGLAALANAASAAPTVKIDSVAQRWPWNNKIDITYTIGEGTDLASGTYYKAVFIANIGGQICEIDGSKDLLAKTTTGQHTVTWTNAPSGVKAMDCRMGAKLYRTSGYYMIVDLGTGAFAFDGLEGSDTPTATPTTSNARYNTDLYKTDWLVLRRIPRTSDADSSYVDGYPTGYTPTANVPTSYNLPTTWVTQTDYFIGVFDLTAAQYAKITGAAASASARPQVKVSWDTLRNSKTPGTSLASDGTSVSVFERLNALARVKGFDLPTSVMYEIADRSGVSGQSYFGGGESGVLNKGSDGKYYIMSSNPSGGTVQNVGLTSPNRWGLYDTTGNVRKLLRDGDGLLSTDLTSVADAFTPAGYADSASPKVLRRNGCVADSPNGGAPAKTAFCSSARSSYSTTADSDDKIGFRVSFHYEAP